MHSPDDLFSKIDTLVSQVRAHKVEPQFGQELARRQDLEVAEFADNDMVLRTLAVIIAYSQQAKSDRVSRLLESGVYDRVFHDFQVAKLKDVNPCVFLDEHWSDIKAIRIKTKVFQLIMAARSLNALGSFVHVLNNSGIPRRIESEDDIAKFWSGLSKLQKVLKPFDIPFLASTTSLLHLLLHIGYDCIKPDLIVMAVAKNLGMVSDEKADASLRHVTRTLQAYALARGMRPAEIDLYFLIHGGQSAARQFVETPYWTTYSAA